MKFLFRKSNDYTPELLKAEKKLGIKFPKFFIDFYQQHSNLIDKMHRIGKDEAWIYLTTDFDWLVRYNQEFLKLPKETGTCRGKICVGTDGCGNDTFINLNSEDERVYFLDHEEAHELYDSSKDDYDWNHDDMEKFSNLKEYVKYYIDLCKEIRDS